MTATQEKSKPHIRTLEKSHGLGDLGLVELFHHRDLLWLLVLRELKVRYTQTLIGPMWAIVNPLVPALLFTFVFTRVVKMETPNESYVVLVTAAMVPWNSVSRSLGRGGGSLVSERQLLTKVYLPRLLVPLAQVSAVIVDLLVSLVIALTAVLVAGRSYSLRLLVLPLLIVWTMALATGVTVASAGLTVRRRDLIHALPFLTQAWTYLSPVAYPFSKVPVNLRPFMRWNPVAPLIQAFQWAITGTTTLPMADLFAGFVTCAIALFGGLAIFTVRQRTVADDL